MEAIKYIGEILSDGHLSAPEFLKKKQGKKFEVILLEKEEISTKELLKYAMQSKSFDFLKNSEEDIYNIEDGEPV
ncbi:hypothetical protein HZA55_00915 [Candidatus Poribacteria bacterium]|nr:hypothetical protein [Candidatus Poribacteria bacterium]